MAEYLTIDLMQVEKCQTARYSITLQMVMGELDHQETVKLSLKIPFSR